MQEREQTSKPGVSSVGFTEGLPSPSFSVLYLIPARLHLKSFSHLLASNTALSLSLYSLAHSHFLSFLSHSLFFSLFYLPISVLFLTLVLFCCLFFFHSLACFFLFPVCSFQIFFFSPYQKVQAETSGTREMTGTH